MSTNANTRYEREREREGPGETETEREGERESQRYRHAHNDLIILWEGLVHIKVSLYGHIFIAYTVPLCY